MECRIEIIKEYKCLVRKTQGMRLGGDLGLGMEYYTTIKRVGGSAMQLYDLG
jgi:hypothetical protein